MIYYKKKIQQDVGATAVEYGILSALIAVVTILGLQATGTNLGTTYCTIANQLSQAVGAGATASGCSATSSSSSSSSSSADGSGSSADSSSSSSSSDSSSSSSDSSSSSSTQAVYDASNSYSVSDSGKKYDNLINLMIEHVQSMTGIYDAQGNAITTPEEYAASLGVSAESYNKMANILNGTNPNRNSYNFNTTQGNQAYQVAFQQAEDAEIPELQSEISAAGTSYYIPDPKNVSFTGLVMGVSQTAKYFGSDTGSYNYRNSNGTIGKSEELISPTGN